MTRKSPGRKADLSMCRGKQPGVCQSGKRPIISGWWQLLYPTYLIGLKNVPGQPVPDICRTNSEKAAERISLRRRIAFTVRFWQVVR